MSNATKTMSPEEMRIAIAKACGWFDIVTGNLCGPVGFHFQGQRMPWTIPNYLNDLNAMNEAENVLVEKQREAGYDVTNPHYGCWTRYIDILRLCNRGQYGGSEHASAADRAKAFLKCS